MTVWIALIRGINVGGHNTVPMKGLRALLEGVGFGEVQTYIQSGNCIFTSAKSKNRISKTVQSAIKSEFGFDVSVHVISRSEMASTCADNPFVQQGRTDPKSIHYYFLMSHPARDGTAQLKSVALTSESFHLTETVFYLHAPEGIGRSKLAASIEKALKVATTARNHRTISKLLELSDKIV